MFILKITLSAGVGIRGLADDEGYNCSLGPHDAFNSLNLITGVVFMTGLLILILFILYYFLKHIQTARKVIGRIIIASLATSIILFAGDAIYAMYVASQLLPEVKRWEDNKSLCGEGVFRSAFAIIVTYFLLIGAGVVAGAVALSWLIYRIARPLRHLCLERENDET